MMIEDAKRKRRFKPRTEALKRRQVWGKLRKLTQAKLVEWEIKMIDFNTDVHLQVATSFLNDEFNDLSLMTIMIHHFKK